MEEFHKMIRGLIFLNTKLRNTARVVRARHNSLPAHFAEEYATVKIDVGRQCGKSEFIRQNSDEKTLIVVRKNSSKEEYRDCPASVLTVYEAKSHGLPNKGPFERIYFDEPSFLFGSHKELAELYQMLACSTIHQTFIHIGC